MATLKEKLTALQMILGDDGLTEQVLKHSLAVEKSADDAGLEFKEKEGDAEVNAETSKAKGKGKTPPQFMKGKKPAKGEEPDEEDAEMDEEDEVEEEEKKAADDDDAGDDAVDDAAEFDEDLDEDDDEFENEGEEGKEFTEFVGDLPVEAFAEMIATTWKEAFQPVAALLELSIEAMKEMATASKEIRDPAAMKELTDRLAAIEKTVRAMVGDMPKATKKSLKNGYRATEDDETVVEGGEEAIKEVGPGKADSGFLNFLGVK